MAKIITSEQAAALIKDNSTIAIGGMGLGGWPEEVAQSIEKRFLETGEPKYLSIKQGSAIGDWKERGTTRWGHEGLVKKWAGAHIGSSHGLSSLVLKNKISAHCLPQGVVVNLWREIAAHRAGLITKVGLGTFIDPRLEGGKLNSVTNEDLVKVVEFEGEEWLFYKAFPVDFALLRGTVADENGNITIENEGWKYEALQIAEAAKNTGGVVIVQVEYLAKAGTLHPKKVQVPGVMVDYVVVATKQEACWQTEGTYYNPAFSGDIKVPLMAIEPLSLNERKIIGRRCSMELKKNMIVNLGYGIPTFVASVAAEENVFNDITLSTESGAFGGIPATPPDFGSSYNAEALIEHGAVFDYYDGGGLDIAYLGLAQTDKNGNINVSKFSGKVIGCGGFINISQNAKKVVFCGTFTNGAVVEVDQGKLNIVTEGKRKKFVDHVEQITFSGKYAAKTKQQVIYITERAVFTLEDGEMTLTEIAPGIDLNKDILDQMEFRPKVSKDLKTMAIDIFQDKWERLSDMI